ncbi:MAG: Flp family type IVb pilin [Rhizobiaceae bacterium]
MTIINRFLRDDNGATAIEYALAAALVSIIAIIGMGGTGEEVNNLYTSVEGAVDSASSQ